MARKVLEETQLPFSMYAPKAWVNEVNDRKFIRENLHHMVQSINSLSPEEKVARGYGKDDTAGFRRCKREKENDNLTQFCVDYPDGSWLSVTFDSERKFPKPPREESPDEVKSFVKKIETKDVAETNKVITRKVKPL